MNGWVMLFYPWHAQNNIVGCVGDVQTERFFIASGTEDDGIVLCDVACPRLTSIGKNKPYWVGLRMTRELILLREVVINKATLSSTVYHSSSWHPPFRF